VRVESYGSAATEANEQASNTSTANSTSLSSTLKAQNTNTEDTTTLSSASASVQSLTQTALETDPARAQKVANLTQAVNSGQYKLDADKIAESLAGADI
jgi:flagellar biosynthesis anti-sigma factor FlgM